MSFLGEEGISTMEDKESMGCLKLSHPTDQQHLKSFLGLASYYRRFVRCFSSAAAPLNCLLTKDQAFTWTGACTDQGPRARPR